MSRNSRSSSWQERCSYGAVIPVTNRSTSIPIMLLSNGWKKAKDAGGKVGRWPIVILSINARINHVQEKHNVIANVLSRHPVDPPLSGGEEPCEVNDIPPEAYVFEKDENAAKAQARVMISMADAPTASNDANQNMTWPRQGLKFPSSDDFDLAEKAFHRGEANETAQS